MSTAAFCNSRKIRWMRHFLSNL